MIECLQKYWYIGLTRVFSKQTLWPQSLFGLDLCSYEDSRGKGQVGGQQCWIWEEVTLEAESTVSNFGTFQIVQVNILASNNCCSWLECRCSEYPAGWFEDKRSGPRCNRREEQPVCLLWLVSSRCLRRSRCNHWPHNSAFLPWSDPMRSSQAFVHHQHWCCKSWERFYRACWGENGEDLKESWVTPGQFELWELLRNLCAFITPITPSFRWNLMNKKYFFK